MFIVTNSYQYYSIKILTCIFMPMLEMSVWLGSSVFSLFVRAVTLQNHSTSYSLNQYSIRWSPERNHWTVFDIVTANDLWYKLWRWNVDLLLQLVIFVVTWSSTIENNYCCKVYYKSSIELCIYNCWQVRNYFTVSKYREIFS